MRKIGVLDVYRLDGVATGGWWCNGGGISVCDVLVIPSPSWRYPEARGMNEKMG